MKIVFLAFVFYLLVLVFHAFGMHTNVCGENARDTHVYVRSDTIKSLTGSLVIKSFYLKDSTLYTEKILYNHIIIKQLMFFNTRGVKVKINLPVKTIYQKNYVGQTIKMQQIIISNICSIKGKNQSVCYLTFDSGCNTCGEFFMVYSQKGELLLSTYGPARFKSAFSLARDYGINPELKCPENSTYIPLRKF